MEVREEVVEKAVKRALDYWLSVGVGERARALIEAIALILVAEGMVANAGLGKRSEEAEEVMRKLSEVTLRDALRLHEHVEGHGTPLPYLLNAEGGEKLKCRSFN